MSDELYSIDEFDESKDAKQYGIKRKSGRFPYGSGENPYQHENRDFLARVKQMEDEGMSQKDIAKALGITSYNKETGEIEGNINKLREKRRLAGDVVKKADMQMAWKHYYKDKMSVQAIAEEMHLSPGTVRNYINPEHAQRVMEKERPLNELREEVKTKKYIDVGKGSNAVLGITENDMRHHLIPALEGEGYEYHKIQVKQLGTGNMTTMQVLAVPGTTKKELYQHIDEIMPLGKFTIVENGETRCGMKPPVSVDSKRVMVNYADTGTGLEKDGVIEIRRGVEDLSLDKAHYAQVRIAVDDSHYLKGMAVYKDGKDMPDGVDIIFNTNKNSDTPMLGDKDHSVLKPLKKDSDNPFGATILQDRDLKMCQQMYIGKDGKEHQSAINVVTEEGKWDTWSRTLASQFLSKQHPDIAKRQLGLAIAYKKSELDDIMNITNPTLKKKMLEEFASGCESDAVHLKAAALPRQSSKVILPVPSLKDGEVYAPGYRDGETVCLVRYPHAGAFEIPMLKVNNSNREARKVLGNAPTDAIGINHHVAQQLSGADFDGDTAIVIPVKDARGRNLVNIRSESYPPDLKNFDNKVYRLPDGVPTISEKRKNTEMGIVSNLITDMQLQGAPTEDVIRATKHSMVVIDSVKHRLDIAASARDFGIAELHERYQGNTKGGAYTIVSKSKGRDYDDEKRGYYKIDKDTGAKIETLTNEKHLSANKSFKNMTDEEILIYNKAQAKYNREQSEYLKAVRLKEKLDSKGEDSSHINPVPPKVPDDVVISKTIVTTKSQSKLTPSEIKTLNKARKEYEETGKVPEARDGLKFKEKVDTLRFKEEDNKVKTSKMAKAEDATSLMSPRQYPMEKIYANFANSQKELARTARKELANTKGIEKSASAAKTYAPEVASIEEKLARAEANRPRERMAQRAANSELRAILLSHPEYKDDDDKMKKTKNQLLSAARSRYKSKKDEVEIHLTSNEWKAIQAGAFSSNKLESIFSNCNSDELKQLATPRTSKGSGLTPAKIALIRSMADSGYTQREIADKYGYSTSTISSAINGTL